MSLGYESLYLWFLCFFQCCDTARPDRRSSARRFFSLFLDVCLENSEFPPLLPTQTIGRQGPVVSLTIKEKLFGGTEVDEGRGVAEHRSVVTTGKE